MNKIKLITKVFGNEKEAVAYMNKKVIRFARSPKVVKSKKTGHYLIVLTEVEESRVNEAIHYFLKNDIFAGVWNDRD